MNHWSHPMLNQRIVLANLPTKIEKLERTSQILGKNIFMKRDDQTGTEFSGNKIRKLEYAIAQAQNQGADTLITCGGIQSNHCRATAAAAAKLGMGCILILSSDEKTAFDANHLLDKLFGAQIIYLSSKEFAAHRSMAVLSIQERLKKQGRKGYSIPVGASNGIGTFGYCRAMQEIITQEQQSGIVFDTIVCAVGSGGTYGGLALGNKLYDCGKKILGFNITATAAYFVEEIRRISKEFYAYMDMEDALKEEEIHIIDGNVGRGYALSTAEELQFIHEFAKREGIALDPVYTGKAMKGCCRELNDEQSVYFKEAKNILFIHTGGLLGLFPKRHQFEW